MRCGMNTKVGTTGGAMRKLFAMMLLVVALCGASHAFARGGSSSDDCTPGSHDPDCVDASKGGK